KILFIDTGFNAFFLFYFGLRLVAADDKLRFWIELNSLVDFFTIPPVFVSYYLNKNWLGLRFLRALRLMELPQILQFLRIIKSNYSIKLSKLFAVFLSTWLTAAGFIHLVENNGDPWVYPGNSQSLSYFKCMYLVMVTMSTVGYGDVVVKTALGRTFIIFFIIGGLVLFANFSPEVVEIVESHKSYKSAYEVVSGKNYIVVCGNITLESVTTFLQDFLLQVKGNICTEILFLGESLPSLELEAVFKCYSAYTTFFYGSALNLEDLKRVGMASASACLILADINSLQPYTEDTSNIMRVLSIKNNYPNTRVILQIIQSHNKVYLQNIPSWGWKTGDDIICLAELKLGFIAQSCLVPGLTDLLTNLFIGKERTETKRKYVENKMLLEDGDYRVLTILLSSDFIGMTFGEVCRLCFVKLNLILLGIEFKFGTQGESTILINPSVPIKLHRNTMGFFIAHSLAEVKRAHFYCKACHSDIKDPEQIKKCYCKGGLRSIPFSVVVIIKKATQTLWMEPSLPSDLFLRWKEMFSLSTPDIPSSLQHHCTLPPTFRTAPGAPAAWAPVDQPWLLPFQRKSIVQSSQKCFLDLYVEGEESSKVALDSTGRFHWCDSVPLQDVLLTYKDQALQNLQDHILVCVFGDANSPLIGLQDFVMPLRASNFLFQELKDIVFLGPLEYLQREWKFIQNFPKLWLFSGSALSCRDLRALGVEHCAACAILSSTSSPASNPALVDAESILATLNVRSMQSRSSSLGTSPPCPANTLIPWERPETQGKHNQPQPDTIFIVCFLFLPSPTESSPNVQFINQTFDMDSELIDQDEFFTAAACTGDVFSDSFLNSLLSITYYNHHILALLQTLVTNGTSAALEERLLEQDSVLGGFSSRTRQRASRVRSKLALLPLSKTLLPDAKENSFGDVYCRALDLFGILCFGLYRLMEEPNPCRNRQTSQRGLDFTCSFRFVIARPCSSLKMLPSDLLFCVVPFS
ncbi:KCNU1 protein, partial [Crypturellus soui]|nr:KCNU1 protein [Crypturellus soui]